MRLTVESRTYQDSKHYIRLDSGKEGTFCLAKTTRRPKSDRTRSAIRARDKSTVLYHGLHLQSKTIWVCNEED